ncbi:hypothetical protein MBM_08404 [Drepanopeziza brunnea f. sp. 'multigermtubi' MB_m1]|uniref:Uncharacterized protein n=1 Tax=Marssonina brunnea f. sp. multigermtubi (strain MB_m1) TaxID=1072389 RepID=K1WKB0_MARBU|nr:uncharacterized protein MBM_08404 [Drepanopeziza brunnea f. sp. 'multigermtubi' MB_m1]EKD13321.1 hypothetical protein MBM_08404 [Drepanopeziza brunnea f. sp. 'multigermtubi' MB_m1]
MAMAGTPLGRLALNAAFLRGVANNPGGLANKGKGFRSSLDSLAGFAFALKTFNLNVAFIRLNSLIVANRAPMIRSASSISPFPLALALTLAAFIALVAPVAFAALVALAILIIVASFALAIAFAAFAAAPAVAITLTKRRAKVKRLLRALINLLL